MAIEGMPEINGQETTARRYQLLLDTLPHGIQVNDCRGVITYSNKAHHRLLGFADGELIGTRIWDYALNAAAQAEMEAYLGVLTQDQPPPESYLAKNRRKDGTEIFLQIDWNYERDKAGELTGFVSVITDITAQRQAETELQKRAQSLALLLKISGKFAETLDATSILQTAVDGLTRLSGLDTAAVYLLEKEQLQLWATTPPLPEDFPEMLRSAPLAEHPHIGQTIAKGTPLFYPDLPAEELTPAEREVVEQRQLRTVMFVPLSVEEQVVGVFIVGSIDRPVKISAEISDLSVALANLTALSVKNALLYSEGVQRTADLQQALADRLEAEKERNKLQGELLQMQKMESIGRLAGGIAHDFNNMLSLILGHAELSLGKLNRDHPVHSHLQQMRQAAQRSADLTRQLLAFARKQTIAPELLDLNRVVGEMLKMLRRLLGEDIDLIWRPAADLGKVMLDPSQIDQALVNLCVNARDAIHGNGKVTIETGTACFDNSYCADHPGFLPGEYVMLAVSDDGLGMDKAIVANIFEPYYTTKGTGKGTGLGLSTVYGIVKQNQGFINVYSEPGQGSCFKIYLPRQQEIGDVEEEAGDEQLEQVGTETILLVEDEPEVLVLEKELLEGFGYRVLSATSPLEAIALAQETAENLALLVTDVVMPQMNGQELGMRLQQLVPELKVLYLSGYTANVIAHHGVLHDGVMFLAKPFSKAQLARKVREALLA